MFYPTPEPWTLDPELATTDSPQGPPGAFNGLPPSIWPNMSPVPGRRHLLRQARKGPSLALTVGYPTVAILFLTKRLPAGAAGGSHNLRKQNAHPRFLTPTSSWWGAILLGYVLRLDSMWGHNSQFAIQSGLKRFTATLSSNCVKHNETLRF